MILNQTILKGVGHVRNVFHRNKQKIWKIKWWFIRETKEHNLHRHVLLHKQHRIMGVVVFIVKKTPLHLTLWLFLMLHQVTTLTVILHQIRNFSGFGHHWKHWLMSVDSSTICSTKVVLRHFNGQMLHSIINVASI